MTIYKVVTPSGETIKVEGPEGATDEQLISFVQSQMGQPQNSYGYDLLQSLTQGATFGLGDEIAAGGRALLGPVLGDQRSMGDIYSQEHAQLQRERDSFFKRNPFSSMVGNIAGGIGGATAAAKYLVPLIPGAASQAFGNLPNWAKLPIAGAGGGALTGAATAPADKRLEGAGYGAAFGGAASAAAPALSWTYKHTVLPVYQALKGSVAPRGRAYELIARVLKRAGRSVDEIEETLKKLGPGSTLADVDDNMRAMADASTTKLGQARDAVNYYKDRSKGQLSRMMAVVRKAAGDHDAVEQVRDQLRAVRREEAAPLYDAAYREWTGNNEKLDWLFKTIVKKKFWGEAKKLGEIEAATQGISLTPKDLGEATPTLKGWHSVVSHLRDRIGTLMRSGKNTEARYLIDLRKQILDEIDEISPNYKQARGIWAGTKHADDMINAGRSLVGNTKLSDSLVDLAKYSDTDKDLVSLGVAEAIQDKLSAMPDTNSMARKLFGNETMRNKLRIVLGPERFRQIYEMVERESAFQETFNTIMKNSQTAIRQGVADQLGGGKLPTISGSPSGVLSNIADSASAALTGSNDEVLDRIGMMLMDPNPKNQAETLRLVNELIKRVNVSPETSAAVPFLIGAGLGAEKPWNQSGQSDLGARDGR